MAKPKSDRDDLRADGRQRPPLLSVRFVLAILLFAVGVAWIAVHYLAVRPGDAGGEPGGPAFMQDLGRWNYLVGFGLVVVGLAVAAHPSTPLGRGRGVVVGMLFCFVVGLLWICTFYVFTNTDTRVPVISDLDQYNLVVGIALMAVGFVYATRWE